MSDEMTTTLELPTLRVRMRHGVRHRQNWLQLIRFAAVGFTGYAVNLAVYAFCIHVLGIDYKVAAVVAFIVSCSNNFWLNRHWTFSAKAEHPFRQSVRFFAVSLLVFLGNYVILIGLVELAGVGKLLAQVFATAAVTPMSFLLQKLWSFRA